MANDKFKSFAPISFSIGNDPTNVDHAECLKELKNKAMVSLKSRDFTEAKDCCLQILNRNPKFSDAYYILALIAGETNQIVTAAKTLDMAISLDPNKVEYYAQKARFLLPLARNREATESALKAYSMDNDDAFQFDTIGCALSQLGLQKQARKMFVEAIKREPDNHQYQYNYANVLRYLGEFDKANTALEKTIKIQPNHYLAHWVLSGLTKKTKKNNHIERLQNTALKLSDNIEAQTFLHYAIGKEYEDMNEHESAFLYYKKGATKQRSSINYNTQKDKQLFECLILNLDEKFFKQKIKAFETEEPIFIIGLPRSGTTLVERIINSHSDVFAAGELLNFGIETKWLSETSGRDLLTPQVIQSIMSKNISSLGQSYIDSTRGTTGQTKHFIDKLPFNFLYAGLIAKALPNAKFIHLKRNAMDNCFSMFKQKFALAYHYSYDLEELGQYYLLYNRLMDHWHKMLPGKILDVSYEKLISDQENISRQMINHCGLEWQDSCLQFHKNKDAVTTASAAQVRSPIYNSSIDKWRRYEQYLDPLKNILISGGIKID